MTLHASPIKRIETSEAPLALGPYSQGVFIGGGQSLVFVSGQLPINPKTNTLITEDIKKMTDQVIDNIEAILLAAGSRLDLVVRTEIFLIDLKNFTEVNEVYKQRFKEGVPPARQTVQVSLLPMGSQIEISCIAIRI